MFNVFSYFYSSTTPTNIDAVEEPINPLLETPMTSPIKYSHVDAHLLIWDLHHLSYHDLEDKYRAKHLTLCNLLKTHGYPIFQIPISTDRETVLIKIPQELHIVNKN